MARTNEVSASPQKLLLSGLAVTLLCLGGLSGISRTFAQQFSTSGGEESTRLRGVVLNRATREPIARALVISNDNRYAALTDDRGQFEFVIPAAKNDPPAAANAEAIVGGGIVGGRRNRLYALNGSRRPHSLTVKRPGFLSMGGAQDWVQIGTSQSEVTLYLVPEARVIGRVIVNGSDGSDRIRVSLYQRQKQGGRELWTVAAETFARMDGEFRFAELSAGAYKVFTREFIDRDPLTFDPRGQLFGYPPMYYPAAGDFESGELIQLKAGQAFQATITPVRREYYRVRMELNGGEPAGPPEITIWPQGHPGPGYELGFDPRTGTIRGLLPNGTYTVSLHARQQTALTGETNLTVAGAPVVDQRVAMVPPTSITVNVQEEFQKERPQIAWSTTLSSTESFTNNPRRPSYVNLELVSDDEFGMGRVLQMRQPSGPDDTALVLENVPPGRYRVQARSQIGYVASLTSEGTDLLHQPLVVAAGATPPEIQATVRDDGAEVDGVVEVEQKDAAGTSERGGAPVPPAQPVYFLPEGGSAHFVVAWVSPDGHFQLQQVAPGDYRVVAFDRQVEDLEQGGGDLGQEYESRSQRVSLAAGQKAHLRLQRIAAAE